MTVWLCIVFCCGELSILTSDEECSRSRIACWHIPCNPLYHFCVLNQFLNQTSVSFLNYSFMGKNIYWAAVFSPQWGWGSFFFSFFSLSFWVVIGWMSVVLVARGAGIGGSITPSDRFVICVNDPLGSQPPPNIKPSADGWSWLQLLRHCHK